MPNSARISPDQLPYSGKHQPPFSSLITTTRLNLPTMPVSPLAPELVYLILGSLPLTNPPDRTATLLACSLVNSTFRTVAQRELGRHLAWLHPSPERTRAFLVSPSCGGRWVCGAVWLREAGAGEVFALLERVEGLGELSLFVERREDREEGEFERVPEGVLRALRGQFNGRWEGGGRSVG